MNEIASETTLLGMPRPPAAELLGWHLIDHDAARGWIRVGFDGRPAFCNPAGTIQGGIQAAMLDDTMGPAVVVASGGQLFTSSIDLNVSFLAPARPGPLFGEATVLQIGKTIAFVEGRLMDRDGKVLACARTSARVVAVGRLERPAA